MQGIADPTSRSGNFVVIEALPDRVRLACEACGAHTICKREDLAAEVLCSVCVAYRPVVDPNGITPRQ